MRCRRAMLVVGFISREGRAVTSSSAAVIARRLLRRLDRASLATSLAGAPYASLVLVATAPDGAPLLLISDLAQHTMNIVADSLVALLYDGTCGLQEPLTGPRVTVLGRAMRTSDAVLEERYRLRHPSATRYADFPDFHFYRVAVSRAHLVAGFGRIEWIAAEDLLLPRVGALGAVEGGIVHHMNADHADVVALYANVLLGRPGADWRLTGIDAEGVDLRREGETARLDFLTPVEDASSARAALIRLAKEARTTIRPK
jgi:putative heme iron utilization protein